MFSCSTCQQAGIKSRETLSADDSPGMYWFFFLVFTTNMKNQTIERKKPTYQKKIQTNR